MWSAEQSIYPGLGDRPKGTCDEWPVTLIALITSAKSVEVGPCHASDDDSLAQRDRRPEILRTLIVDTTTQTKYLSPTRSRNKLFEWCN